MAEPIVMITHFRIKAGVLEELTRLHHEVARQLRVDQPRTLVHFGYLDDAGTQVSFIHLFADAESMDLHMQGGDKRARAAYEYLERGTGWEVYGRPSRPVLEALRQEAAALGVALSVQPDYLGGFLRLEQG